MFVKDNSNYGTVNRGIIFTKSKGLQIIAYCDSDWGNDPDTRRSKTGDVGCRGCCSLANKISKVCGSLVM